MARETRLINTAALRMANVASHRLASKIDPSVLESLDEKGLHVITGYDPFKVEGGEGPPDHARTCINVAVHGDTAMRVVWCDLPLSAVEAMASFDGETIVTDRGGLSLVDPFGAYATKKGPASTAGKATEDEAGASGNDPAANPSDPAGA